MPPRRKQKTVPTVQVVPAALDKMSATVTNDPPRPPVRKALCIGIEYVELSERYSTFPKLTGTYQDTMTLTSLLKDVYGYREEDIKVLTDVNSAGDASRQPTRDNIIAAMKDLVRDARAGDRFVFHYSGHGSQVPAPPEHVEELDHLDETLWPSDVQYDVDENGEEDIQNYILDNEIKDTLIKKVPAGARLVCILDNCSSGTGVDLENYSSGDTAFQSPVEGQNPWTNRPTGRARAGSIITMPYNALRDITNSNQDDDRGASPIQSNRAQIPKANKRPFVTSWSACRDDQNAFGDDSGGIFIKAFTDILKELPHPTHKQLLKELTRRLKDVDLSNVTDLPPVPQLGSNHDIKVTGDITVEF